MEKKYKLTEESIDFIGKTLYRIEALKDFGNIKKGDKGGFVECEANLSQKGNCWIYNNAKVYDNAKVRDDAKVFGDAEVFGNAYIEFSAQVYGKAKVRDRAYIWGNARVFGNAKVYDRAEVRGDAKVYGKAHVDGSAEVFGNAVVKKNSDYIVFKNWWSNGWYFTWTRSNNMWRVGCFYGTGEELIAKAYEDSELSGREYKRVVDYVESILQDNK